jgi:GT2 family glycosyltransferase
MRSKIINVSIVLYKTKIQEIRYLQNKLNHRLINKIYFIDNSPSSKLRKYITSKKAVYLKTEKNIGYGSAHNIALKHSYEFDKNINYHIVMNSDIKFDESIIDILFDFMNQNKNITMISPVIKNFDGKDQLVFRNFPNLFFSFFNRFFHNTSYFKRFKNSEHVFNSVPSISGCFMFIRVQNDFKKIYFDQRYFMYMEDVDFCRQLSINFIIGVHTKCILYHKFDRASSKIFNLFLKHFSSIIKYHLKWGFYDRDKNILNNRLFHF